MKWGIRPGFAGDGHLASILGGNQLTAFGLREALGDLCGDGFVAGGNPILIGVLLSNDGKSLIYHLFGAHA